MEHVLVRSTEAGEREKRRHSERMSRRESTEPQSVDPHGDNSGG